MAAYLKNKLHINFNSCYRQYITDIDLSYFCLQLTVNMSADLLSVFSPLITSCWPSQLIMTEC